jgi:hypothetical protein
VTNAASLAEQKSNLLAALLADSLKPKPDYSIDGQTVSRSQWRKSLLDGIKEIDELIQVADPYELRGQTL